MTNACLLAAQVGRARTHTGYWRRMKEEGDALSNDAIESHPQSSATTSSSVAKAESVSSHSTSNSRVTSSTNGTGSGVSVSVISSPLRRPRPPALEAVDLVRAQIYGNALVTIGTDLAAAAAAAASGIAFPVPGTEQNRILMQELAQVAARNALSSANSTHSKSSSDGSNSASPLSLSMGVSSKPGPKPRAADSPGSGSTTSTTTGTGPGRDKVFVCHVCNRSFGYKHVLQNHERTHTGEKPFECRECHKRFTRDHHLKTHMRLHTGEKPYHCTHCERQFVQVANLRRHLRVHTGERPYHCEYPNCPSKFSDSNQLKAHMLIHKGEKPFECQKCSGRFRRRHHLMHHKCPNDECNIGKPRRGRRPKAYDPLVAVSPTALMRPGFKDETHIPVVATAATVTSSTAALAAAATSSSFYHHLPTVPQQTPPPVAHLTAITSGLSLESGPSKSRRKPRQTIRILTPQHREHMFLSEHDIQTQPLNLSLSPSLQQPTTLSVIVNRNYASHTSADVLDLSRSRSDDSEAEAIEEEVEEDEDDEMYDSDHYPGKYSPSDKNGNGGMDHSDHEENGNGNGNGAMPLTKPKTSCWEKVIQWKRD